MRRVAFRVAACSLALAVSGTALPVAAQETATSGQKSGTAATVLSVLVPGAGHIYTGETGKGLVLLGVGVGGAVFGAYMWQRNVVDDLVDDCYDFDCALESTSKHSAWAYAGMVAYLGAWVYGIADASSSAHRMNERNARGRLTLLGTAVEPVAAPTREGFALGLRIATH